jgi:hypothetical protein
MKCVLRIDCIPADSQNSKFFILNFYFLRVAPEHFKVVIAAGLFIEDVDDNIDKIEEYPVAPLIARFSEKPKALRLGLLGYLVSDAAHLPVACARGNDEVVRNIGYLPQVEHNDAGAMALVRYFRRGSR